jgi:hypothetical protein
MSYRTLVLFALLLPAPLSVSLASPQLLLQSTTAPTELNGALDSEGRLWIAWTEPVGGGSDVYYAAWNSAGRLSLSTQTLTADQPALERDSLIWVVRRGGPISLLRREQRTAPVIVDCDLRPGQRPTCREQACPGLRGYAAAMGPGGSKTLVRNEAREGTCRTRWSVLSSTRTGTLWGDADRDCPAGVSASAAGGTLLFVTGAVARAPGYEIMAQVVEPDGAPRWEGEGISLAATDRTPKVQAQAAIPGARWAVLFTEAGATEIWKFQVLDSGGQRQWPEALVLMEDLEGSTQVVGTVDAAGRVALFWEEETPGRTRTHFRQWAPNRWEGRGEERSWESGEIRPLAILSRPDGRWDLLWEAVVDRQWQLWRLTVAASGR